MGSSVLGAVAALIVGAGVATATVFGVVNAQTSPSGPSPTNVENAVVQYGTSD